MPRAARKMGIGIEFQAIQVCSEANKILQEIYPPVGPFKIISQSFKKGELLILAPSSASSQDISMRKDELIKLINQKLGRKMVRELRTKLNS